MCLNDPRIWITTGLVLDIVGAVLMAVPVFADEAKLRCRGFSTEETVRDRIQASCCAKIGVILLVVGFVLQLVGTWVK